MGSVVVVHSGNQYAVVDEARKCQRALPTRSHATANILEPQNLGHLDDAGA
jgi:hypothetical protein